MRPPYTAVRFALLVIGCTAVGVPRGGLDPSDIFRRGAPQPRAILNIAHAGASSLAPQNTIAAGQKALEAGADVWGIDVRSTRDGVLVLMHDETLERTTDVEEVFPERAPWRVADFTLEEIRRLDAGSWFATEDPFGQIEAGSLSTAALHAYVGEPIPTLHEALEFVTAHEWRVDVELKPPDEKGREAVARRLVDLIRETETATRVLVSSFDHDLLREVKRLDPTIPVGALVVFAPLNPVQYLEELQVEVYLPSVVGFTPELLEQLEERGIKVFVWTYNTREQLKHALGLPGVDGIYTDFPQRLTPMLVEWRDGEAG